MTQKEQWRELLLKVILIVGGITLTVFPVVYALKGQWLFAILEGISGIVLWVSLYLVNKNHSYKWPSIFAWSGVMLVLVVLLFTGGIAGTGYLWWSLLPITSFILFGSKTGARALFIGGLIFLLSIALDHLHLVEIYYATTETVMLIVNLTVVSLILFNYEKIFGQARDDTEKKADLLEGEALSRKNAEEKLTNNLNKLKEEEGNQANIRSAMLNLLEDSKELEKALQEEKEGVEKKVEERTLELSNTKARLDSSIENLPLGFLMADIEEKIVVTNPLANTILKGKNEKENLEILKKILKDKLDLSRYIKNCGKEKKRQAFSDIEIEGRFFQFLLSPILTNNTSEVCIGVVILIQDITEAKILDRSKDEFFSIASHELRTPLTAIRGNTSMILEYYADAIKEPELKAMVDDIHASSIRLINIVNDFLNVSRLEQSRMVYDLKELELEKLIPEIIKEYDVTGSRRNLNIDFINPASPIPKVLADSEKVRQVLINLLGNAIKFTTKGGIKIDTSVDNKFVKILVTDTGRGIPLKQQSLLFHKFQQTGSSLFTRDTAGGSGLGLYISKMMAEGMGGSVALEKSEIDKGSTFSLSLPVATQKNKVNRLAELELTPDKK